MIIHSYPLAAVLLLFCMTRVSVAAVRYVDANGTNPVSPYSSWATAATNIEDAVQISGFGDSVQVTNGVYQFGSVSGARVYVSAPIAVQSVNGPAFTVIQGYQIPGTTNGSTALRCAYLSNGSMLSGFTLTNGATASGVPGGGVQCASLNCLVTNCIITGNSAYALGGGAYSGTLINCTLSGNVINGLGNGGGADYSVLINCLLIGNQTGYFGAGAAYCSLTNCTIVSNTAVSSSAGAVAYSTVRNCIAYYNTPDNGGTGAYGSTFSGCCTYPLPSSGNITNPPVFMNLAAGDYHLSPVSPCINAGSNSFVTVANDFDGNPRIIYGTVDIGAYESSYNLKTHYVSATGTNPVPPFNGWTIAATNIQDAVDVATNGDSVLVTNGLYQYGGRVVGGYALTNRVAVTRAVAVQSVNGPTVTVIRGNSPRGASAVRCVYLTNGASLTGFTLTNGATLVSGDPTHELSGGGLLCESLTAAATNCTVVGCSAFNGGGVEGGTLNNCTVTRNSASYGGGVYGYSSILNGALISNSVVNCVIASNTVNAHGGGAFGSLLNNCVISSNTTGFAYTGGGAAYCTLNNCLITNNSTPGYQGGGVSYSALTNCLLIRNWADLEGGAALSSLLVNCTVVSNFVSAPSGSGGGTYQGTNLNCIVYFNSAHVNPNYAPGTLSYCDTLPLPTGQGNITNDPGFVNLTAGDFHLQPNSPCINSGQNNLVSVTSDWEGNPRIVGGTVDIGACEFQTPASVLSYAWALQYGLATDGSSDYVDSDGTGMNNWQKWIAGLDPTNPASMLAMQPLTATNNVAGVIVSWQSVNTRTYYVQRSVNLRTLPAFSILQSNIVGQVGSTSFTDTSATNRGPYFYRVGVQ